MGLLTKTKLGSLYDLFGYTVRTWHTDRNDSENSIWQRCKIGTNSRKSNPNFILNIYENREWNDDWTPDGRFVVDFVWPWDSDSQGENVKECICEPEDLKQLADFIYDFLKNHPSWGTKSTTQTKINNQYKFNSQYVFNYFIDDKEKHSEIVNFDFVIEKYDFKFKTFEVKVAPNQWSKEIDQPIDIIMNPVQLKEFADFIYNAIN